jgi:hypothetical protein
MLFKENLEEIIFNRHEIVHADELIVLSGYVGPNPVQKLQSLPFPSKVIYGMYGSEGIQKALHTTLVEIQESVDSVNIFYSNLPVHSKCYVWRNKGNVIHALVGSANFSNAGLRTPLREVLAETTRDTFDPLNQYIQFVLNNSISCLEAETKGTKRSVSLSDICSLSLVAKNGEVQNAAGLNWGQNPKNHTKPNDAYIKIRASDIRSHPDFFPPKLITPINADKRGKKFRHNDPIEIIWDDGITMEGLLEATQTINGIKYPKQISSFPIKSEMGEYLRHRLNVPLGQPVKRFHLDRYGRTDITVTKINEGLYKFDFSVL